MQIIKKITYLYLIGEKMGENGLHKLLGVS